MSSKLIAETELAGQVLHLTLNAPKGNILDMEMMRLISQALDHVQDNTELKLIVLEGAGPNFSFGASVEEHTRPHVEAMLRTFGGVFERLINLHIPTLSLVRGQCLGGGAELALFSTWVYATPDAHIGFPEIKLAVFPPVAAVLLPWRTGGRRALELQLTGRSLSAEEAERVGLVDVIHADPSAAWHALAVDSLLPRSASALRFAERVARRSLADDFRTKLPEIERIYLDELMSTSDANEGLAAFLERRDPHFGARK